MGHAHLKHVSGSPKGSFHAVPQAPSLASSRTDSTPRGSFSTGSSNAPVGDDSWPAHPAQNTSENFHASHWIMRLPSQPQGWGHSRLSLPQELCLSPRVSPRLFLLHLQSSLKSLRNSFVLCCELIILYMALSLFQVLCGLSPDWILIEGRNH